MNVGHTALNYNTPFGCFTKLQCSLAPTKSMTDAPFLEPLWRSLAVIGGALLGLGDPSCDIGNLVVIGGV